MEKFKELGLNGEILNGIAELGFETPSAVQEKAIPVILGEERDLVVLAQTGTGKTAAFGLPLLQKIDTEMNMIQVLILSPTRELCVQIGNDLKRYAKYLPEIKISCVYGGTDIRRQMNELKRGVQVLVATPGRLCDLIKRKAVDIEAVRAVVLDEADEMLNMGFKEDLNFILEETPEDRNTYLFSATMPKEVERISKNYLTNPHEISTGKKNQGADTVTHIYYQVKAKDCYETLHRVIDCEPDMYAIIFTRTKMDAREIVRKLQKDGIECNALHGDLSQAQRDDVMLQFRSKRLKVLVATDVAARGLDVDNLTHVINYNLPEDVESYTHRSGRTGRAGKTGVSIAIINSKEKGKIRRIESIINKKFVYKDVPGGDMICSAQLNHYAEKIITAEPQDTLGKYKEQLETLFADFTKEQLLDHIFAFEFGKLIKKYDNVEDLNLSADERQQRGGADKRDGRSRNQENVSFTLFSVNVGRNDGFMPRDLMGIINQNSPKKGLEIGSIRIFDDNTKFEVEVSNPRAFISALNKATFKGDRIEFSESKQRFRGADSRGGSSYGGRDKSRSGSRGGNGTFDRRKRERTSSDRRKSEGGRKRY